MEFIEDDNEMQDSINISNVADWMKFNAPSASTETDPFKVDGEELRKINGLGSSFRRKMGRDLQKRFVGIDGTATQQNLLAQAITGYAMFDLIEPPYNLEYLSKIYEISPYNYAAINAKVSNIVGLGYSFEETGKTKDALDEIDDPKQLERARNKINRIKRDLEQWLESVNEEETFTETLVKAYVDLEATGNGYIEIGRTVAGNIGYIGHIPAKTMRVRRLRDGFIQLLYGKAVYFRNFGDTDSERKLLEFFQVGLKGKNHRSLYIPLPPDSPDSKVEFKMEPIEAGTQEGSFNTYRLSNRDEILLAHRVPINKVGTPAGVNLAVARDADKTFREQVCGPAQNNLAKKLNKIIEEKTDALLIKFNELTLTDEDTQSKIDERYLRMQVITPNEVRIRKGMIPIEGGDEVVDLKADAAAEQVAQAGKTRTRDSERSANSPDKSGEGRNAKGDGRSAE